MLGGDAMISFESWQNLAQVIKIVIGLYALYLIWKIERNTRREAKA